jgi:tetratricopeptide (TPR) repeat protein
MTEIALRTYNQEIKDLIEHGHYDEAIAHCQHILETYPRHIETYRMLGKSFLEQGRHGDAADVFQRVLSAIPEDWLSHVAMAIVREDESNLDMAIWHMERAYEVNPSNPTVQQEVRRLRGRRDGVEPPKLRLTRSALARMYIKGGLYGQAIAEIRSALAEDPDRPDLQTLLASALFDSGAVQEAADICSSLLQKLPYCMEANRILGLALLISNKADDAEKLFQRMESLDPYLDVDTLKKEKRISEHPVQAIALSRLTYEGEEKAVPSQQPSWASSLGLNIEDQPKQPAIPDWLSAATQQSSTPAPQAATSPDAPSWIDQAAAALQTPADVGAGAPAAPMPAAPESGTPPIERTATGELPDWIQKQTPPEEEHPEGTADRQQLPDWLSSATTPPPSEPPPPATESETVPDWIKTASLPPEKPKETITGIPDWLSQPSPPSVDALPSSSLPEWTRPETKTGPIEIEPTNIPDWLNTSQPTSSDLGPEPEWLKQPGLESPTAESIPEWMKEATTPTVFPTDTGKKTTEEEVPDWLREPSAPAVKPIESVPEWMRSETPVEKETPPVAANLTAESLTEDIPEWMKPEPAAASAAAPAVPGEKAEAEVSQPPPESAATPEITIPDWMKAPAPEPTAAATPQPEEQAPEAVTPSEQPERLNEPTPAPAESISTEAVPPVVHPAEATAAPEPAESTAEAASDVALPDWLKAVPAAEQPATEQAPAQPVPDASQGEPATEEQVPATSPEAVATPSAAPSEEEAAPPQEAVAPPSEPGPAHVTPTQSDGIDLPDWLSTQLEGEPKEAKTEAAPSAEHPSEPLPDWLKPAEGTPPPAVVDWEKAASQPVPPALADATRPATGVSSDKGQNGGTEIPGWLDKSKPTGSDTVARWLDRRLKTSTLSSLDEAESGGGKAPSEPAPAGAKKGTKQLPTWLDTQKPGGSDTVVRWMDKRETGSLRKPVTASFSAVSKGTLPLPTGAPAVKPDVKVPEPPSAPSKDLGNQDTAVSRPAAPAGAATAEPAVPKAPTPPVKPTPIAEAVSPPSAKPVPPPPPTAATVSPPPAKPIPSPITAAEVEAEEEGEMVPPPEWLQKALGNAVAEVPPIPKKQTGGLKPGTVTAPVRQPAQPKPAVAPTPPVVEEPAPTKATQPGTWVPIAPAQAKPTPKAAKPKKKSSRKKSRKLSDAESKTLLREARSQLETDLQKAYETYQQVIDDPANAEIVAGDLTAYLEQDPASPQLWNLLGDACSRAGRLQDAYKAYGEALRRM